MKIIFHFNCRRSMERFISLTNRRLARLEHEPRSLMPSNYGSMLSPGDLDDLVSYLMTAERGQTSKAGEDDEP